VRTLTRANLSDDNESLYDKQVTLLRTLRILASFAVEFSPIDCGLLFSPDNLKAATHILVFE